MALVGYMGSGKTTVGRLLARRTGASFVDLDHEVSARAGLPIPKIFARRGEGYFRDLESRALLDALDRSGACVISCGGGAVLREENRAALGRAKTVFLREDTGTLYARTRGAERPLRAETYEGFEELYAARLPLYRQVADLEVEVDGRRPRAIAEEVDRWLRGR